MKVTKQVPKVLIKDEVSKPEDDYFQEVVLPRNTGDKKIEVGSNLAANTTSKCLQRCVFSVFCLTLAALCSIFLLLIFFLNDLQGKLMILRMEYT